jgi:hypothetical protein
MVIDDCLNYLMFRFGVGHWWLPALSILRQTKPVHQQIYDCIVNSKLITCLFLHGNMWMLVHSDINQRDCEYFLLLLFLFLFLSFNSPWIIHYLLLTRANIDRPDLSYRIDIIHTNCLILVGSYLFNHDYLDCTFWFWQTVFYSTIFFIFVFIFNFSHIMILWVILELSISSPQYSLINRGL